MNPLPEQRRPQWELIVLLLATFVAGFIALLYSTRLGVGTSGDSMDYISTARSIVAGRGIMSLGEHVTFVPLTIFPPFYPIVLAISGWFGQDPLTGSRWVQAILFGAMAVLTALAVWRVTRSLLAAGIASLLAAATVMETLSYALSEGLFIVLLLTTLLLLAAYLDRPRWWLLITAGIVAGLALLTRYAGVSVLLSAAIMLLIWNTTPSRGIPRRIIDAGVFLALAIVPTLAWSLHLGSIGNATGRNIVFHPPTLETFKIFFQTISGLVAKGRSPWIGIIIVMGVLGYLAWRFWPGTHRRPPAGGTLMAVLLAFALVYVPFLIISIAFMDAATSLNSRILSPLVAPMAVVAIALAWEWTSRGMIAKVIVGIALAGICGLKGYKSVNWCMQTHHTGIGYNTVAWRKSPTLKWASRLPRNQVIYSNGKDLLYFLQDRLTEALPLTVERKKKNIKSRAELVDQMESMRVNLAEHNGYLIYFDAIERSDYLADPATIQRFMPIQLFQTFSDGKVYRLARPIPLSTQGAGGL